MLFEYIALQDNLKKTVLELNPGKSPYYFLIVCILIGAFPIVEALSAWQFWLVGPFYIVALSYFTFSSIMQKVNSSDHWQETLRIQRLAGIGLPFIMLGFTANLLVFQSNAMIWALTLTFFQVIRFLLFTSDTFSKQKPTMNLSQNLVITNALLLSSLLAIGNMSGNQAASTGWNSSTDHVNISIPSPPSIPYSEEYQAPPENILETKPEIEMPKSNQFRNFFRENAQRDDGDLPFSQEERQIIEARAALGNTISSSVYNMIKSSNSRDMITHEHWQAIAHHELSLRYKWLSIALTTLWIFSLLGHPLNRLNLKSIQRS